MTLGTIFLNNDTQTFMNYTTDNNDIKMVVSGDADEFPSKLSLPAGSFDSLLIETDGVTQSWFSITDGGTCWAAFDLGEGLYDTKVRATGTGPNFGYFMAGTDILADSNVLSVANFHYCWGANVLGPVVQSVIDANIAAMLSWLNGGEAAKLTAKSIVTVSGISSDTTINCYYGAVVPKDDGTVYVRLMLSIDKMIVNGTLNQLTSPAITLTASPVHVYIGGLATYSVDDKGKLKLSLVIDLAQFGTSGWDVSCTELSILEMIIGHIFGGPAALPANVARALMNSDAENWLNTDPINEKVISLLNDQIAKLLG